MKTLNNDSYKQFGKWNSLKIINVKTEASEHVIAHDGDFFPEMPEDYLEVVRRPVEHAWPVRADIDLTNICNHACPFCFSQFDRVKDPKSSMDSEIYLRTLDELTQHGTISIRFCGGGEPLAHPNAFELMKATLDKEVHVTLLTNGDLFSEKYQEIFARHSTYVRFSVNSFDSQSRALMHGTSLHSFKRLLKNIESFVLLRRKRQLTDTSLIGAIYLLDPRNVQGLESIARQIKEIGVNHLAYRQIKGTNFSIHFDTELEQAVRERLNKIKQELDDEKFTVFVTKQRFADYGSLPEVYFEKCLVCKTRVIIESNGAVQMCPRARGEYSWRTLGILSNNVTLKDIWDSGIRKLQDELAPSQCPDCIDISSNQSLNNLRQCVKEDKSVLLRKEWVS